MEPVGFIAITTPPNPIKIANHLRHPIISLRKIIAKIHEKIGTAWDITVTSATGSLWKAKKNIMFPVSPAKLLKKWR